MPPLVLYAKLAGAWTSCLADKGMHEALVKRRMEAGKQLQTSATPSFAVNYGQEVISGARDFEEFDKAQKYVKEWQGAVTRLPAAWQRKRSLPCRSQIQCRHNTCV
jgi:hypothetical protein